ncbi:HAD domain-containing protein [Streptomyces sp. SID8352]|uniref:HAD domain-containing protein n=1 Tax=Streptomyces sp. SID8352 TaxID=2690338 RepID=UPI001368966D|nr:hypothetical protein [Streptomyces sp. SID8352]
MPPPLLFLDVDGPLLPFGSPAPMGTAAAENPLLERLDPRAGARLLALGCVLVWATTWGDEANEVIAPLLGLPPLPVMTWGEEDGRGARGVPRGLHWKVPHLVARAGGRAFVWVDDEIGAVDRLWVAAEHPGAALLHRVEPHVGLTGRDFDVIRRWVREVGGCPGPVPGGDESGGGGR